LFSVDCVDVGAGDGGVVAGGVSIVQLKLTAVNIGNTQTAHSNRLRICDTFIILIVMLTGMLPQDQ
jgi:hypothetical protein